MSTHHKKKSSHKSGGAHNHSNSSTPHSNSAHETHKSANAPAPKPDTRMQTLLVIGLVFAAFFGAYRFAQASSSAGASPSTGIVSAAPQGASGGLGSVGSGGASAGGGCCGGGGAPIEGAAAVEGGVQKISVDLSSGSYNPNVIKLKAGVPTEVTFGQSSGCTAQVQSADLGFAEDLTSGPKTVKLGALKAGTYSFACGMNMVTGQIVVES
jgi:plastocyanin